MITRDRYGGEISFSCDGCPEVVETHCESFPGALAKAKSRGWTVRKSGNEWSHHCPDCSSA